MVVAGPIGSGRSSALLALIQRMRCADGARAVVVAFRPSPLRAWAAAASATDPCVVLVDTPAALAPALDQLADPAAAGGDLLAIDDAEGLGAAHGANDRLEAIVRTAGDRRNTVLMAARVNDLPGMFDPWARYLVSLRRALLLQPTVDDAFLFGTKLPVIPPPAVAGRGVLIDGGTVTVVQVAEPEEVAS